MSKRGRDQSSKEIDSPTVKTVTDVDDLTTHDNDPVLGLQIFGTVNERRFPAARWDSLWVGSDSSADIRIVDQSVSRRHARLVCQGSTVIVIDEHSKNGTYAGRFEDDARIGNFTLKPGTRVSFGHVLMFAFSARTEELRKKLQRFLGYHPRYAVDVDNALYAALRRRRHVVLKVPVVVEAAPSRLVGAPALSRLLHETAAGSRAPYYETSKQLTEDGSVTRIDEARAGTLIVNGRHWPTDGTALRAAFAAPIPDSRLGLVVQRDQDADALLGTKAKTVLINVATMEERGDDETERAIMMTATEYGNVTTPDPFTEREWADFRKRKWGSPENLEFHIRRLVRVVTVGIAETAELEGISVQAMSQWAKRNVDEDRRRP